jgi:hypothetical protein
MEKTVDSGFLPRHTPTPITHEKAPLAKIGLYFQAHDCNTDTVLRLHEVLFRIPFLD